jgi:hypothetical protein
VDSHDPENFMLKLYVYLTVAAGGGAMVGLAQRPKGTLIGWKEKVSALFGGAAFSFFFVPWLLFDVMKMPLNMDSARAVCFFGFLSAAGSYVFLPRAINGFNKLIDRVLGNGGDA